MSYLNENDSELSIASIECIRRNVTHFRDIYGPFPDETITDFVDRMLNVFGISEQDVYDIFNFCPVMHTCQSSHSIDSNEQGRKARRKHFDSDTSTSEEMLYKSIEDDPSRLTNDGSISQAYESIMESIEKSKSSTSDDIKSDKENIPKKRNKGGNNNNKKELPKPLEPKKIKDVKRDRVEKQEKHIKSKNEQKQNQPKKNEEEKKKAPKLNQIEEKKEKIPKKNQVEEKKKETTKNKELKQIEQKQEQKEQKKETQKQSQTKPKENLPKDGTQNKEALQDKKPLSTKQKVLKWGSNLFTQPDCCDTKCPKTCPLEKEKPKIIATTWAISRVNIFNDCTRTFEIMKPKKTIPKDLIPQQSSLIFAVMPSGVCVCFDCLPNKPK